MVALPQLDVDRSIAPSHGCGSTCGAGLEEIYPTTAVRYGAMNWIGEFTCKRGTVFKCGAKVVIASERGTELGQQVSLSCNGCNRQVTREQIARYIQHSGPEFFRLNSGRILREATSQDIDEHNRLNAHIRDDIDTCALLAAQLGLDMKVVAAEHLLGGERVVFYFRSEERIDFRQLVKQLARTYHTRIEMRQVGARDEARLVADYEVCGRECCCKNFLKKLRPVNMKMAKLQKSTLDPSKVSGRCGRLRCCLRYEHLGYEELDRKLPPLGTRVATDFGDATVVDRQILTQLLMVKTDDDRSIVIPVEEVRGPGRPQPTRDTRTVQAADDRPTGPGAAQPFQRGPAPAPPIEPPRAPHDEPPAAPPTGADAGREAPGQGSGGPAAPDRRAGGPSGPTPPRGPRRRRRRRRPRGGPPQAGA